MATATKKKNVSGDGDRDDDKDNENGLVDFNATDVKKVLKRAQKRGFITHDEINALLPNDEMTSDQIEDVMSQISEQGIAVVESEEEAEAEGKALTKIEDKKVVAKKGNARGSDRTDDPVRMYLREMGSVELLSREGEIKIAKRIEAAREEGSALFRVEPCELGSSTVDPIPIKGAWRERWTPTEEHLVVHFREELATLMRFAAIPWIAETLAGPAVL